MKARHPLNRGGANALYSAIRHVERQRFLDAEFWLAEEVAHPWRFGRIMNDVNRTNEWQDEQGLHPMAAEAVNTIARRTVDRVL